MDHLAVSSIAWTNEEEPQIAAKLQELGVKHVEIAPTKIWDDPTQATDKEISDYLAFWKGYGIEVVAFQSMLFSRPDLKIFESEENRAQTMEYLTDFVNLAGKMGAQVLVFGSPKNRQRGDLATESADSIAQAFFKKIGDSAQSNNTCFCIEPNPTDYACDYVTNTEQGMRLVDAVDNPGFGLHLDIAGMTLAGDPLQASIESAAPLLRHFHASSPQLGQVEQEAGINHEEAARTLGAIGYGGYISIEMRPSEAGENVARVEKAVRYIQSTYGPYIS